MAHKKFDLVQETSTSTGATTMALAGAVTRRRRFGDVLANADTCYVFIEHASAAEWQICLATWNTGHSLTLGTVLASSTGSAVTFSAGTKTISLVAPASKSIVEDNNGDVSVTRDVVMGRNATVAGTLAAPVADFVATAGGTVTYKIAKVGNLSDSRYMRMGVYAYSGNQAPFIQSYHTSSDSNPWNLLLNPDGGNVGIGVAGSITNKLTITTASATANLAVWTNGTQQIAVGISAGNLPLIGTLTNDPLLFYANNSEVMRYVPGTGLGLSKTPTVRLDVSGAITASSVITSSNIFMHGDGSHGYIRATTGNFYLGTAATNAWQINATGSHLLPGLSNTYNIGSASLPVKDGWIVNAWTVTSGRAAKTSIASATEAEKRAAATIKANPRRYKMAEAVDKKGDAARWHFGYIAEDVRDALEAEGLDPWAYGFLCSDPLIKSETYFETVTRPKMRKVPATESVVEIIDGKPIMVAKQIERDEPVGAMVAVVDEAGQPVMQQTGADEETGEPIMAPLMHFVPEMEEYQAERTREVDTGEVRLGLRYSELEAFLRSAD